MLSALAPRCFVLLLLAQSACVLQATDLGPLAELRSRQEAQAKRVAEALCESYYACDCSEQYDLHTSEAECIEQVSTALLQHLEQGIDRELDYDPRCLDAHAELFEGLGCASGEGLFLEPALTLVFDEAWDCRTYHGDLELEQDCDRLATARGDECDEGFVCEASFGVCIDHTPLPEGSPCGSDERRCAPELVCDWSSAHGEALCIRPAALGASCASWGYCEGNGWCDPSDSVCRPLPELDEPCLTLAGLPPTAGCAWGLVCDAGTCTSAATEGSPCYASCAAGLACEDGSCIPGPRALVCGAEAWLP